MLRCLLLAVITAGILAAQSPEPQLSHAVFFTLKDKSPASAATLAAECRKYLQGHPGEVYFSAGTRAVELKRDVNDQDFQVSLTVIFRTKADHDRYQTAPKHLKFIEANQSRWEKVRVFDSYLKP
ncbi:MAG: Dabb family protein [Acidobacteria bacterium]|nr:Dabb family protein [Acidobacteriota bacterium]